MNSVWRIIFIFERSDGDMISMKCIPNVIFHIVRGLKKKSSMQHLHYFRYECACIDEKCDIYSKVAKILPRPRKCDIYYSMVKQIARKRDENLGKYRILMI
jgi:hypothetical protein